MKIQTLGNDAVTVLCDVALGTFPGLRPKVRTNAVALLGWVDHPQAAETLRLLVGDVNPDVKARALRAVGRKRDDVVVDDLGRMLREEALPPVIAAEVVKALLAIDSAAARVTLAEYEAADASRYPHRAAPVVRTYLHRR